MTLIDLGEFKLRFDSKEVRISIDGDLIDIGARTKQEFPEINESGWAQPGIFKMPGDKAWKVCQKSTKKKEVP